MDHNGAPWDWHRGEYSLQNSSNFADASPGVCSGVTTNQEDHSYMFDETTPIKSCGDFAYHIAENECVFKEQEECRESSIQAKRRRMLQFSNPDMDQPLYCTEMSSVFLKSKELEYTTEEVLPEVPHWSSGFTESIYEGLDPSTEGWLAECFNDAELICSPDEMNLFEASDDVQIDVSDFCNTPDEYEANMTQESIVRTPSKIVFKGRKSFIQTPTKLASSIVSPFAFVKPCGMQGDMTLNDINQRIQTPPPSKLKQIEADDDLSASYPTSAFSGKPVVAKTKIHIEGGKGSITIMRTKG